MAKERPVSLDQGDDLPLGSRIRLRRQAQGVRLSAMAAALDYDRGYLSRVENNKAAPSDELAGKISQYLGLDAQRLREAPLSDLMPSSPSPISGPVLAALPVRIPPQKRAIGQRLERLIAAAHLSAEEADLVADHLAAVTREVLALVKAGRRREDGASRAEHRESRDA